MTTNTTPTQVSQPHLTPAQYRMVLQDLGTCWERHLLTAHQGLVTTLGTGVAPTGVLV